MKETEIRSLLNPKNDRMINELPLPPQTLLNVSHLYYSESNFLEDNTKLNWKKLMHHFQREGRISKDCCSFIIKEACTILSKN